MAARDVRRHLEELLPVVFGEAEVSVMHGSVLRTVSAKVVGRPSFLAPRPIRREIEFALLEAIAKANRLIYIETQFLRDRRISKALARAARRNANLTLILILPAAPEDVAYGHTTRSDARFGEYLQAAAIRRLRRAFSGRLFIGSPVQPVAAKGHGRAILHGSPIVYVHAKVAIFDNQLAIVGSANLNGRSLRWDTEVAVALRDPETVRALRNRCMEHMLGLSATDRQELFNVDTAVSGWQNVALANAKAAPHDRDGLVVPYLSRPGRRFGRALPAVPEEMV
ncbi:MAG: phospholipase D-like domain-containing protein [Pseudomonadota bacterium]